MARVNDELPVCKFFIDGDEARKTMNDFQRAIDEDTKAIAKNKKEMEGLEMFNMQNSDKYHELQRSIAEATDRIKVVICFQILYFC